MGFQNCISNYLFDEMLALASYQNAQSGGIRPVTLEMQVGFYFQSFRAVSLHSETCHLKDISV